MARSYGVLKTSVWEPGSGFRMLSPLGQWCYAMLISQPQISNLGVLPFTPEKWARLAGGLTLHHVEQALAELADGRYVIVDEETGELLVRTFIKHDKVWSQPKLVANARKLIREVESETIRDYLADRHPWLANADNKNEILAFEQSQEGGSDTPSHTPSDRGINGSARKPLPIGVTEPLPIPHSPPRAPAGPGAGAGSSSRGLKQKPSRTDADEPAAAELEAPRERDIVQAVEGLRDADTDTLGIVLPLATQLPAVLFADVLDRLQARIANGGVRNHTGQFIQLLRVAAKGAHDRAAIEAMPDLDIRSRIQAEAASYAISKHPWDIIAPLLENYLRRHGANAEDFETLMDAAGTAFAEQAKTGGKP